MKTAPDLQRSQGVAAGAEDQFLRSRHLSRAGLRLIVEAMQMQKPMDDIEAKLAREGTPKCASMSFRCLNANKDLTMLKRKNVGWA
jgi:hypothetical protein